MSVVKIDENNIDSSIIEEAALMIKNGGIVAFPTETVYGLGADATNDKAIMRIFNIKGRPPDNPLIAHVHSLNQARAITKTFPEIAEKLADNLWPGPLTLVLKKNAIVSEIATAGLDTIAVRMPSNPIAIELIKRSTVPIVAPSANISGRPSPTNARHVEEDIGDMVDMLIDGGHTHFGIESTVVDVSAGKATILRLGSIEKADIEAITGAVSVSGTADSAPKAPGMKYAHYSPDAKVILVREPNAVKKASDLYNSYKKAGMRVGVISFTDYAERLGGLKQVPISSLSDPKTYMRKLYATLRDLDKETDVILVIDVPEESSWMAVKDKISKAADETQ